MTLEQLRAASKAGGVSGVTLKGQGGGFLVQIATRSGSDAVLAKARSSEPRRFGNPLAAERFEMYTRKYNRPVTIYLDQDGPLADFQSAATAAGWEPKVAKMQRGFYRSLPLTPGARKAVAELLGFHHLHVFVATKIPDRNPYAATEKILWLNEHLPGMGERIIITPNKACIGTPDDFLVDDRAHKADASFFRGTFIHFGAPEYPDWESVMKRFRKIEARRALGSSSDAADDSRATVT